MAYIGGTTFYELNTAQCSCFFDPLVNYLLNYFCVAFPFVFNLPFAQKEIETTVQVSQSPVLLSYFKLFSVLYSFERSALESILPV